MIQLSAILWSLGILTVLYYIVYLWMKKAVRDQEQKEDRYPSATKRHSKEVEELLEMDEHENRSTNKIFMQKKYDYEKAKKYIDDRVDSIASASMGMNEDWFWTADEVFTDGKYTVDLTKPGVKICGIDGSYWATPSIKIEYKDGTDEMLECSMGEQDIPFVDKIEKQMMWTSGCLSGPCQENTPVVQRKI